MTDDRLPLQLLNQARGWLERRQAGEDGVEARLAAWLAADARHRQAFAHAELVWSETGILQKGDAGFDGVLMQAPFYQRRSTHVGLAVAAAIALAGFASIWIAGETVFPEWIAPARAATYETKIGEIRTFRLADASMITLDTDTRVAVTLSGGNRQIALSRGRIRLEGAVGSAPAKVLGGAQAVTVSGGAFDAALAGKVLRIGAPVRGIELSGTGTETASPREVPSGSQVEIGGKPGARRIARQDVEWISGMLALDGTRLDEAVHAINRYNTVKVRLSGEALGGLKMAGAFRATDPQGFAEAAGKTLNLRIAKRSAAEIVLSAK